MTSQPHEAEGVGGSIVALCGGVGGAKLVLGLNHLLGSKLTVIANTGDDFKHLGLHVSPDIDTILYTLGGLSDVERGWGRSDESWQFMSAVQELGREDWFKLGDRDLAMHVLRTQEMQAGLSLTAFTTKIASRLGIAAKILPMSDEPVSTVVATSVGRLGFQEYFVKRQCSPKVESIEFINAENATPSQKALAALRDPDLAAVIICPSNPYLSINPILAISEFRRALTEITAPIIAVSPLIGGKAVKGPTAKIMEELGVPANAKSIIRHYPFVTGLIIDEQDRSEAEDLSVDVCVTSTLMTGFFERVRLGNECLSFLERIAEVRRAKPK